MSDKTASRAEDAAPWRSLRHRWVGLLASVSVAVSVVVGVGCGADGPNSASDPGSRIVQANCASCHAADLGGTSLGPSLLDPMYGPDQLSDAEFADAIRNGVVETRWDFGPMPANGGLTDAQIDSIIAVVRAQQRGDVSG